MTMEAQLTTEGSPLACRTTLVESLSGGARIKWNNKDKLIMISHLARHQITLGNYKTEEFLSLCTTLGVSHGPLYNSIIHPRVQSALLYRLKELEKQGHVSHQRTVGRGHRAIWARNTRAWARKGWDGSLGEPKLNVNAAETPLIDLDQDQACDPEPDESENEDVEMLFGEQVASQAPAAVIPEPEHTAPHAPTGRLRPVSPRAAPLTPQGRHPSRLEPSTAPSFVAGRPYSTPGQGSAHNPSSSPINRHERAWYQPQPFTTGFPHHQPDIGLRSARLPAHEASNGSPLVIRADTGAHQERSSSLPLSPASGTDEQNWTSLHQPPFGFGYSAASVALDSRLSPIKTSKRGRHDDDTCKQPTWRRPASIQVSTAPDRVARILFPPPTHQSSLRCSAADSSRPLEEGATQSKESIRQRRTAPHSPANRGKEAEERVIKLAQEREVKLQGALSCHLELLKIIYLEIKSLEEGKNQ